MNKKITISCLFIMLSLILLPSSHNIVSYAEESHADTSTADKMPDRDSEILADTRKLKSLKPALPQMTVSEYLQNSYVYPNNPQNISEKYRSVETNLKEINPNRIILAYTWDDLTKGLETNDYDAVVVMDNLVPPTTAAISKSLAVNNRKLILEGNGYTVDFQNYYLRYTADNNDVTIQNINTAHGGYYGFLRPEALTSIMKIHNVHDIGNQFLSSKRTPVQISGEFSNRIDGLTYTSPVTGNVITPRNTVRRQQNFESANLEVFPDAILELSTYSGSNIDITDRGDIIFYENSKLSMYAGTGVDEAGEGNSGYGINARYSVDFLMKENSEINFYYIDPGTGARNRYNGFAYFNDNNSLFSMEKNSKININLDSHRSTGRGIIHFNRTGAFNMDTGSELNIKIKDKDTGATAINMAYPSADFILNDSSKLNIDLENTSGTLSATKPVINLSAKSSMAINKGSELNINTTGYTGNMINLNSGTSSQKASFSVGSEAALAVNSLDRRVYNQNVIDVGNYADFKIDRLGSFLLNADKAQYIFSVGSSSLFQFEDAKLVDIGFSEMPPLSNTNSALINMNGKFLINIQRVKAWNRGENIDLNTPTYDWNPMFNMVIPYNGTVVDKNNLEASSLSKETTDSFLNNFNTGKVNGFQRLRFEFIPDVNIELTKQPVDNPDDINSRTIEGVTNPGAVIRLSEQVIPGGYDSFPEANNKVPSPIYNLDGTLNPNFTTIADQDGKFTFTVPTSENIPFVAGSTIQAYAFLNGKSDSTDIIVKDTTPPKAVTQDYQTFKNSKIPDVMSFITELTDSNPNGDPKVEYVTPEAELKSYLSQTGNHKIELVAFDKDGNKSYYEATLIVVEKQQDLSGNDVSLAYKDTEKLIRSDFEELIKNEIAANAYSVVDDNIKDLTDKIQYNFQNVENKVGEYTVILTVSEADSGITGGMSTEIKVSITEGGPTAPVNPNNPSEETPPNGSENNGTNNTGDLRLDYVPSTFDFGNVVYSPGEDIIATGKNNMSNTGQPLVDQWVQISDDRYQNGWTLSITQESEFTSKSGGKLLGTVFKIPEGTIKNSNTNDTILNSSGDFLINTISLKPNQSSTVFSNKGQNNSGKDITTYTWKSNAVSLEIPAQEIDPDQEYTADMNWTLISGAGF